MMYENLKRDTFNEIKKVLDFIEFNYDEELLVEAIELSDMDNIKRIDPIKKDLKNSLSSEKVEFARSGKVRQWEEYFKNSDIDYYENLIDNLDKKSKFPYA